MHQRMHTNRFFFSPFFDFFAISLLHQRHSFIASASWRPLITSFGAQCSVDNGLTVHMSSEGNVWSTIEIFFAQALSHLFINFFSTVGREFLVNHLLTVKVSRTAANLFVDTFIRFWCIQRLPNAHRCLIEMAGATFWYMRITINLQQNAGNHTGDECVVLMDEWKVES